MKILVTGGAGFIGSHLVDALLDDPKNEVTVLDNFKRGKRSNLARHKKGSRLRIVDADIRDYDRMLAISKVDVIYHLAAQSNVMGSVNDPDYTFNANVAGTYNVAKAACANKVKKLIFSSSREVYGEARYLPVDESHPTAPKNMYGTSKLCGEKFIETFSSLCDLNYVIFRVGNVYGTRDTDRVIPIFIRNALKGNPLVLNGAGRQVLDFIYIDDVLTELVKACKSEIYDLKTINLATGKGTSIRELATLIIKLTRSKSTMTIMPRRDQEVENFIGKSNILKFRPVGLDQGIVKMLGSRG